MKFFSKYKYWKHSYKKLLGVLILFSIILLASVPVILLLNKFFPQSDKSATFTLYYDSPDIDFGTIDYSGIENNIYLKCYQVYYLDGQLFVTDSSGLIEYEINDFKWHNLTIIWHDGVLYEYLFNSSITQDIVLATKSIDAMSYWDEIFLPADWDSRELIEIDLLWFDGTGWVVIETLTASLNGSVQLNNLIMGLYALSESGDNYVSLTFTIDQATAIYINDIYIVPDKTIVDVDYLDTIFGDMPVDLSAIDWVILGRKVGSGDVWQDISLNENWWLYFDVSDIANGVITIYEILDKIVNIETTYYEYKIVIGNAWIGTEVPLVLDTTTPINLVAKSLDATIVWSSDGTPYIDMMVPLYCFDGSDYVFVANYLTNSEGKIYIDSLMPTGMWMLGVTEFNITADDVVKTVTCIVESLFWRRENPHLDSNRDIEFKYFFFFMLTIKIKR